MPKGLNACLLIFKKRYEHPGMNKTPGCSMINGYDHLLCVRTERCSPYRRRGTCQVHRCRCLRNAWGTRKRKCTLFLHRAAWLRCFRFENYWIHAGGLHAHGYALRTTGMLKATRAWSKTGVFSWLVFFDEKNDCN